MSSINRHVVLTAIASLASVALIWWVEPNTSSGVIFLVTGLVMIINGFGALLSGLARIRQNRLGLKAVWPMLLALALGQAACGDLAAGSAIEGATGNITGGALLDLLGSSNGNLMGAAVGGIVGAGGSTAKLRPARAFLRAEEIPPPGVGAYGVVALRSKPTSANLERLMTACRAFLSSLPSQSTLPASLRIRDQMITIWPLMMPNSSNNHDNDCEYLTNNYELYGGISAIEDAAGQGRHLNGRGPFLIGWSPSEKRGQPDAIVLVLDMSSIDSQASFDDAFGLWQQRIVENPELWRHGFSSERLRLAIRDFADHYGQDILAGLRFWGKGS